MQGWTGTEKQTFASISPVLQCVQGQSDTFSVVPLENLRNLDVISCILVHLKLYMNIYF